VSLASVEAPPAPPKKPASAIQRYSKEFLLKFIGVSFLPPPPPPSPAAAR